MPPRRSSIIIDWLTEPPVARPGRGHRERHRITWRTGARRDPASREILSRLTPDVACHCRLSLADSEAYRRGGPRRDRHARELYSGESGWELHHDLADQVAIYDALKSVTPVAPPADFGFYAMNSMRMEKAFPAWGVELTVENNPVGVRAGSLHLRLDKREFIGRESLIDPARSRYRA